jgi:hypothetical protein
MPKSLSMEDATKSRVSSARPGGTLSVRLPKDYVRPIRKPRWGFSLRGLVTAIYAKPHKLRRDGAITGMKMDEKPSFQKPLAIEMVHCVENYGILVFFNDGTTASYTPEELAQLRPYREVWRPTR